MSTKAKVTKETIEENTELLEAVKDPEGTDTDKIKELEAKLKELEALLSAKADQPVSAPNTREDLMVGELSNDHAEKVKFTVPINEADPKDKQLTVAINGHHYTMLRGETVEVPEFVVLAYQDSVRQRMRLMGLQEKYSKMVNLTEA